MARCVRICRRGDDDAARDDIAPSARGPVALPSADLLCDIDRNLSTVDNLHRKPVEQCEDPMKLRFWAKKSDPGERAGQREVAKRRVQGDLDKIRQTQGRANEPNKNQGLNGGFGGGTY